MARGKLSVRRQDRAAGEKSLREQRLRREAQRDQLSRRPCASDAALVLAHERLRASLTAQRDTLAVEETALGLLSAALDCAYRTCPAAATSETAHSHREKMHETALFLASHFHEEHSLDQIARAVHCSAFHLARLPDRTRR